MSVQCIHCGKKKSFLAHNYAGFQIRDKHMHPFPERIAVDALPGRSETEFLCVDCANKVTVYCTTHGAMEGSKFGFGKPPRCLNCDKEKEVINSDSAAFILTYLDQKEHPQVRIAALSRLAEGEKLSYKTAGGEDLCGRITSKLKEFLADSDPDVVIIVIHALGRIAIECPSKDPKLPLVATWLDKSTNSKCRNTAFDVLKEVYLKEDKVKTVRVFCNVSAQFKSNNLEVHGTVDKTPDYSIAGINRSLQGFGINKEMFGWQEIIVPYISNELLNLPNSDSSAAAAICLSLDRSLISALVEDNTFTGLLGLCRDTLNEIDRVRLSNTNDSINDNSSDIDVPSSKPSRTAIESQGISALLKVCSEHRSRLTFLEEDPTFCKAVEDLKREGSLGAQALAVLIDDLLAARCDEIRDTIEAASCLSVHPELVEVLRRVISAPSIVPETCGLRFPPVICGDGKMGWDDIAAFRIKRAASEALNCLLRFSDRR